MTLRNLNLALIIYVSFWVIVFPYIALVEKNVIAISYLLTFVILIGIGLFRRGKNRQRRDCIVEIVTSGVYVPLTIVGYLFLVCVIYISDLFAVYQDNPILAIAQNRRLAEVTYSFEFSRIKYIVTLLIGIYLVTYHTKIKTNIKFLWGIAILLLLVCFAITGGRSQALYLLVFMVLCSQNRLNFKNILLISGFFMVIIVGVESLRGDGEAFLVPNYERVLHQVIDYIASPTRVSVQFFESYDILFNKKIGASNLYTSIFGGGIDNSDRLYVLIDRHTMTNAYGAMSELINDFGYIGTIGIGLIYGAIGILLSYCSKKGIEFLALYYQYQTYLLFMFFSDSTGKIAIYSIVILLALLSVRILIKKRQCHES